MSKLLILIGLLITALHAAEPTSAELLRQGLFEEEANRNLDKAAEHYRAVIAAHERERVLAASATFRLGEIARKKNDKEAAAAAFRTVVERFPEQTELARLSRENLAALGLETSAPAAPAAADPEDAEIARLKELARNSPDLLDGADAGGLRPIHHAAAKGWNKVTGFLLESGADPDGLTSNHPISPLHIAAGRGHLAVAKTLLAAKADPNLTFDIENCGAVDFPPRDAKARNAEGRWTALDMAILYNRRETALALIQASSDFLRKGPLISGGFGGANSLQLAIYLQHNDLAQAMIDAAKPVSANVRGDLPLTSLAIAVIQNPAMVVPLLKAGADVRETLIEGATALHWAGDAAMAELLISKGADPNAKNAAGLTPLDYVAQRSETGNNPGLIETLLKHGATVADPHELLRRTSDAMLPVVGVRLVYPKVHDPDAILLAASGDHSFTVVRTSGEVGSLDPFAGNSTCPEIVTLEKRLTEASPPPSLAEALRQAYRDTGHLQSIRILRRNHEKTFEIMREWKIEETPSLPTEWPALEWGDIVEVHCSYDVFTRSDLPTVNDLSARISSRTVNIRLGELEVPKTIAGNETFWLGGNDMESLEFIHPSIGSLVFLDRCILHRKGLPGPLPLDFSEPAHTRFRLLDGDTIELELNQAMLGGTFNQELIYELAAKGGWSGTQSLDLFSPDKWRNEGYRVDFSRIAILRRAEHFKPERVDIKAWLEKLPPQEKWEQNMLVASMPKANTGDVVVLFENQSPDAEETNLEIIGKMEAVREFLPFAP